jgi:ribosomal protein S30
VIKNYTTKDMKKASTKSPKIKAAPKKGEIFKEGDMWKFIWIAGKVRSYTTKEEAKIRLEKFIEQSKRET